MKGLSAFVVGCTITLAAKAPPPAEPVDPIDGLIEACRTHAVVALSEGRAHGDEQGLQFRVFVVRSPMNLEAFQADVVRWPIPSFASVPGTSIGSAPEEPGTLPRMSVRGGTLSPLPREEWQTLRMEEQIDAVLYLGPASNLTIRPAKTAACGDRSSIDRRLARIAMVGLPPSEADRLRQTCAAAPP